MKKNWVMALAGAVMVTLGATVLAGYGIDSDPELGISFGSLLAVGFTIVGAVLALTGVLRLARSG